MFKRFIIFLAIFLAGLVTLTVAGCSTNNSAPQQASDKLAFTAKTIDGTEFDGTSLSGKPAVLWFWAPWCPTCQMEAPTIESKAKAFPSVQFVGVAARDNVAAMRGFVDKYKLSFPQVADTDAKVWGRFGVVRQPALAFVDAHGQVELRNGVVEDPELDAKLQALSGAKR